MSLASCRGRLGEDKAAYYLQRQGWKIIDRNWHCCFGEIDIIARKGQELGFFEVKWRTSEAYGGALYSITDSKKKKLSKSIESYLQQHPTSLAIRVDALLLQGHDSLSIHHIPHIL